MTRLARLMPLDGRALDELAIVYGLASFAR